MKEAVRGVDAGEGVYGTNNVKIAGSEVDGRASAWMIVSLYQEHRAFQN